MRGLKGHQQPATKLMDHVHELQMRTVAAISALVVGGVIAYVFYSPILDILRSPLGTPLYYTNPAGSFAFVMKISFMGGLAISMPVIVYNLIMFVRPAFAQALTLKRIYITTAMSSLLAISGAVFGFKFILPGTLHFFGGYQIGGLSALISADSYLNFVTNIIIAFMLVFQLPLLISFIDIIRPLKPKKLFSYEKWAILGSLIISLIAPFSYDIVTSLLVALPIIVLFNLSIVIVMIRHATEERKARTAARAKLIAAKYSNDIVDLPLDYLDLDGLYNQTEDIPMPTSQYRSHQVVRDVMSSKRPPTPVEPPEWYLKKHRAIMINQSKVISDFRPAQPANRALTSQ